LRIRLFNAGCKPAIHGARIAMLDYLWYALLFLAGIVHAASDRFFKPTSPGAIHCMWRFWRCSR